MSTSTTKNKPSKPITLEAAASVESILAGAQSGRPVIQDFVPLADSLEWNLGQEYLRQRGNKAFLSDASPVPYVINNDGTLSQHAADVFFASLVDAEKQGPLEDQLCVLELGIGVGLFARYFLDAFRDLCQKHGKDWYDRLTYIAADRSERMLHDVCRYGVLAPHPGRYRLRRVDAMNPGELLPRDLMFHGRQGKPLRAVFLNYLLDCLPAAMLEIQHDSSVVKQLCVRTCVARNIRLEEHTDLTVEMLAERAKRNSPADQRELLEVYGLFASEYDYRPVDIKALPLGDFALQFGSKRTKRLLHSYGAIQSLEKLLDLIADNGFILANDYGQTQLSDRDEFEHQRFSLATFVGVNFRLLQAYFGDGKRCQFLVPPHDEFSIHSRLLARNVGDQTFLRFHECFGKAEMERLFEPLVKARECIRVGRFELAANYYRQALERQPWNWVLVNETAMFLIFSLRDVKAGIDLAKLALARNPTCSAELWNTLGDGLFEWGRYAEARSAYKKALAVNESDVRARYNLAWVLQREKDFPAALSVLAEAYALDKTGQYRDRLVQKQTEVLTQMMQRHQQEYLLLINLVSKFPTPESGTPQR